MDLSDAPSDPSQNEPAQTIPQRHTSHVSFTHPHSFSELVGCAPTDCLSVCIGLINVFVLQFVVVVLLFFSTHEIDLARIGSYYPGYYHGGT